MPECKETANIGLPIKSPGNWINREELRFSWIINHGKWEMLRMLETHDSSIHSQCHGKASKILSLCLLVLLTKMGSGNMSSILYKCTVHLYCRDTGNTVMGDKWSLASSGPLLTDGIYGKIN